MPRQNPVPELDRQIGQRLRSFRIDRLGMNAVEFSNWVAQHQKGALTGDVNTRTYEVVKPALPKLIQRLKRATEARGSKTELAAWLKVPRQSVTDWLSGRQEPGGETTLQLLNWVEQRERQK